MSKSKGNTIDPEPMLEQYGADAIRWFMLGDSPPERDLEWSEAGIEGTWRFANRIWRLVENELPLIPPSGANNVGDGVTVDFTSQKDLAIRRISHRAIAGVAKDIEDLQFNKAVAKIHSFVNALEKAPMSRDRQDAIEVLVKLIAPMLPHLAEDRWAALGNEGLIAGQPWPSHDPALLVDDEVTIAVQVMGKLRDTLTVPKGTPKDTIEALALASEKVQRAMDSATPKKVIVVPDRLVNIVL